MSSSNNLIHEVDGFPVAAGRIRTSEAKQFLGLRRDLVGNILQVFHFYLVFKCVLSAFESHLLSADRARVRDFIQSIRSFYFFKSRLQSSEKHHVPPDWGAVFPQDPRDTSECDQADKRLKPLDSKIPNNVHHASVKGVLGQGHRRASIAGGSLLCPYHKRRHARRPNGFSTMARMAAKAECGRRVSE